MSVVATSRRNLALEVHRYRAFSHAKAFLNACCQVLPIVSRTTSSTLRSGFQMASAYFELGMADFFHARTAISLRCWIKAPSRRGLLRESRRICIRRAARTV